MKLSFVVTLGSLTSATSHSVQAQRRSDSMISSSFLGNLGADLSNMAQNSLSWINDNKEDNEKAAAQVVEKTKQRITEKTSEALQYIVENVQNTVDKAYEINYADLPEEVKTWMTAHPYQTTFHVINGIVLFYPGLITGPIFWFLGWTSAGPRAGSAAAALMAKFGVVSSRSAYAYLQSSAMGGYGSTLVQGVTRAWFAALGVLEGLSSYLLERETSKTGNVAGVVIRDEDEVDSDSLAELKAKL